MTGTVTCWIKEQMGWLHGEDFVDCMRLDTSLRWMIVRIQLGIFGLIALGGFLFWKGYRIPPILVRIVLFGFVVGVFLSSLT